VGRGQVSCQHPSRWRELDISPLSIHFATLVESPVPGLPGNTVLQEDESLWMMVGLGRRLSCCADH